MLLSEFGVFFVVVSWVFGVHIDVGENDRSGRTGIGLLRRRALCTAITLRSLLRSLQTLEAICCLIAESLMTEDKHSMTLVIIFPASVTDAMSRSSAEKPKKSIERHP